MVGFPAQVRDRSFDGLGDRPAEVILDGRFNTGRDVLAGLPPQSLRHLAELSDGRIEGSRLLIQRNLPRPPL